MVVERRPARCSQPNHEEWVYLHPALNLFKIQKTFTLDSSLRRVQQLRLGRCSSLLEPLLSRALRSSRQPQLVFLKPSAQFFLSWALQCGAWTALRSPQASLKRSRSDRLEMPLHSVRVASSRTPPGRCSAGDIDPSNLQASTLRSRCLSKPLPPLRKPRTRSSAES